MVPSPLRIAVVGAGAIGTRHAEEIAGRADTRLAALVDPAPAAAAVAARLGVRCLPALDVLLAQERPDGVVIASPNALHAAQAEAVIARGIPVLVEKPITATVAEGRALLRAAEAAGVPLLVGHHRRYGAILRAAIDVVRSGGLGDLVGVTGTATFHKPDAYFREAPWRSAPGGGPILLNLIHEIDNLRALVGEIVAVQAVASSARRGFAVEDTAALLLQFDNGALGTFLLSDTAASPRSWEQTTGENPRYARDAGQDCYVIAGTRGSLGVPTMRIHRYRAGDEPSWWTPFETVQVEVVPHDPLAAQIAHFAAVIRGEAAPLVTGRDGLANLRVTEAIVEAARTGMRVAID